MIVNGYVFDDIDENEEVEETQPKQKTTVKQEEKTFGGDQTIRYDRMKVLESSQIKEEYWDLAPWNNVKLWRGEEVRVGSITFHLTPKGGIVGVQKTDKGETTHWFYYTDRTAFITEGTRFITQNGETRAITYNELLKGFNGSLSVDDINQIWLKGYEKLEQPPAQQDEEVKEEISYEAMI